MSPANRGLRTACGGVKGRRKRTPHGGLIGEGERPGDLAVAAETPGVSGGDSQAGGIRTKMRKTTGGERGRSRSKHCRADVPGHIREKQRRTQSPAPPIGLT